MKTDSPEHKIENTETSVKKRMIEQQQRNEARIAIETRRSTSRHMDIKENASRSNDRINHPEKKVVNDRLEKAMSTLSKKKYEEIKHVADGGNKSAQKILDKWTKSTEQGKLGPAARGNTADSGTKNWKMLTREIIKNDPKIPKEVRTHYEQQDSRIIKDLEKRKDTDVRIKNLLDNEERLKDYLARRNSEPPGYDLGHQPGDKLGDKPGRLENKDMNEHRGRRFRL